MILSNRRLITLVIICILIYLLAFFSTLLNFSQLIFIITLNIITSFLLVFYWVFKQFRIKTHFYELREMAVLFFEILILVSSLYAIFLDVLPKWIAVIEYGFFVLHLIVLILCLIFILTFKIRKLF